MANDPTREEMIEYLKQVLQKKRMDDAFFGYIYTIDDKDDPFALTSWQKANPGPWYSLTGSVAKSLNDVISPTGGCVKV